MQTTIAKLIEAWGRVENSNDTELDELEVALLTTQAPASVQLLTLQMCVLTSKAEVAGLADDLVVRLRESCRRNAEIHLVGDELHLARRYVG